jgi:hypothetical protein
VIIEVKTGGASWVEKKLGEAEYDLVEVDWTGRVDMDITPLVAGKSLLRPMQPRVDRVLDAMGAEWDPAARGKLAKELIGALEESWPIAGIVADAPQGLVHNRVEGVRVWDGWIDLSALKLVESK